MACRWIRADPKRNDRRLLENVDKYVFEVQKVRSAQVRKLVAAGQASDFQRVSCSVEAHPSSVRNDADYSHSSKPIQYCQATSADDAGGGSGASSAVAEAAPAVFSSTPWPLHSGQELRPVVSHCEHKSAHYIRHPHEIITPSKKSELLRSHDLPDQCTPDGTNDCT